MDTENKKKLGLDLATINTASASNEGAEIELLHPVTNAKTDVFISVLGKDSDIFRDHVKSQVNDRLRREAMAAKTGKNLPPPTAEQAEEDAIALLTLCTTGWRNMNYEGTELPFNVANVSKVYRELIWVRRQIDDAIGDLENFMKV